MNRTAILLVIAVHSTLVSNAYADLYQVPLRTVEWLVDNSDTIAVYRLNNEAAPLLMKQLKGDASKLVHPLRPTKFDGYQYFQQPVKGPLRLCFVRGKRELLEQIEVGREQIFDKPSLDRILYGVDQFGSLIVSEESLFQSISARIASGPGVAITPNKRRPHIERSGVVAPRDFPLESNGNTYVLIVPFTKQRRDHYLAMLRNGAAAQQVKAIRQLQNFDDDQALAAIKAAAQSKVIKPSIRFYPSGMSQLGREEVLRVVKEALRSME